MNKNVKIFLILSFLTIITVSCKHFNGYTINGKITNAEGEKVYLDDLNEEKATIIDTATIKNATFELKNYSSKGIYRLRFGNNAEESIFIYLEPKSHINITADLKKLSDYKIDGNDGSKSIQQLVQTSKVKFIELDTIFSTLRTAPLDKKDSIQTLFASKKKAYTEYIKNFAEKEPNNDVACFALNFFGPMMQEEIPFLVDMIDKLHTSSPDSKYIDGWYKQMKQYRDAVMQENEGGIALNTQAPNIILQNPKGDTIQLKNLEGNYVLLDFWASWCNPCRMENPNVVALYNKYHSKGFEVFSVSLDANAEQWKKAIEKDKLVWKNHGCDFGSWNSAPAQLYKVQSIPCTFLLDKTGKVIAKNLRGQELADKLATIYAEQPAIQ